MLKTTELLKTKLDKTLSAQGRAQVYDQRSMLLEMGFKDLRKEESQGQCCLLLGG